MGTCTLGILSDIHYAGAAEQARGQDFELRAIASPVTRAFATAFRHFVWQRNPLGRNHLLDRFLAQADRFDYVIANGDFSCNSGFVGVSDDASCESARECLDTLRRRFGDRLRATCGDHELGKISMFGGRGGMRLASWHRARQDLGLQPLWRMELGRYVLLGFTSSLVALPLFEPDMVPAEQPEWERLRAEHLADILRAVSAVRPDQRLLLFCHDPTALAYLWREEVIRAKAPQVELTIVGHLHSNVIFWKSRLVGGLPAIRFLGHTIRRLSTSLSLARHWRPFHVRLCPALAGIELLKDGGYCTLELDPDAGRPARFRFHRLER